MAVGGQPAENVLVRLESFVGSMIGQVMTDRTGKFRFAGLARDQYIVTIHAPGFKDAQQQIDLQTNFSEYVLLQLVPDKSSFSRPSAESAALVVINAKVPAEAQKEFEQGQSELLDHKNVQASLIHLEKAIELYPNFFEAQMLLGTAYMDAQQWDKAARTLHTALAINGRAAPALFALGEVYRRQKKYAEAERALQDGLKLDERSAQGHFTLGRVYWDEGDFVKAGPQIGRALILKPDYAEAHLLAGNILLRAHQPENSLAEFEEYVRLAPNGEFAAQARQVAQRLRQALAEKKR
jgi:tetratricopeptide (TPR) repeat protein